MLENTFRCNHTPQTVPGESSYNSKDVSNHKPAIAACGRSVDLTPQLDVLDHTETVGKTSSKPHHSKTAGCKLSLRCVFLTFITLKSDGNLTVKAPRWHYFKGSKIQNRLKTQLLKTHWKRPHTEGKIKALKCEVTPFHLITLDMLNPNVGRDL